jgi:hypothetical protein
MSIGVIAVKKRLKSDTHISLYRTRVFYAVTTAALKK